MSDDTKKCPYCAETIKAEAVVCRFCGRDLIPAAKDPLPVRPARRRRRSIALLLVAVLAVLGLGAFALYQVTPPQLCSVLARDYIDRTQTLFDDWDDVNMLAASTSRIALAPVVSQMQDIRREAADIPAPPCAEVPKTLLIDYMDKTIDAYLAFMQDSQGADQKIQEATAAGDRAVYAFIALKTGQSEYIATPTPVPPTRTPAPTRTPQPTPTPIPATYKILGDASAVTISYRTQKGLQKTVRVPPVELEIGFPRRDYLYVSVDWINDNERDTPITCEIWIGGTKRASQTSTRTSPICKVDLTK